MMIKLKLWEILKKLKLNKKYYVKVKKEEFIKKQIRNVENVNVIEDEVIFYTNEKYDNGVNRYKCFFNKVFKSYYLFIISFIIIFGLLFCSNNYIREVVFEDQLFYSESVYNEVCDNLKKVGRIYLLKGTLNELNSEIQKKFYNYSYIGLVRKTGKLIIVIRLLPKYDKVEEENDSIGNLVSAYNAYIVGYKIKKGVSLVNISQVVRAGDVLITGNLKHHLNINNKDDYVHPSGAVFGRVVVYEEVVVNKVNSVKVLNGNVEKYYLLRINNFCIGKEKEKYSEFDKKEKDIFKLFSFIKLTRIIQYEKEQIIIDYDGQTSFSYAVSELERRFIEKKRYEEEKITSVELIDSSYKNGEFRYLFCVKKVINIAEFKNIDQN